MTDFPEPADARGVPYRVGDLVQIVALHIELGSGRRSILNVFNRAACRPLRIADIDGLPGGPAWLTFHVRRDGSDAPEDCDHHSLNILPEEVERVAG